MPFEYFWFNIIKTADSMNDCIIYKTNVQVYPVKDFPTACMKSVVWKSKFTGVDQLVAIEFVIFTLMQSSDMVIISVFVLAYIHQLGHPEKRRFSLSKNFSGSNVQNKSYLLLKTKSLVIIRRGFHSLLPVSYRVSYHTEGRTEIVFPRFQKASLGYFHHIRAILVLHNKYIHSSG